MSALTAVSEDHIRDGSGRFVKGVSGNPGGRPKNPTPRYHFDIKLFASEVLYADDPSIYISNLRIRILEGSAPHMERFLAEHLWGRPKGDADGSGGDSIVNLLVLNYAQHQAQDEDQLRNGGPEPEGPEYHHPRALPAAQLSTPIPAGDAKRY